MWRYYRADYGTIGAIERQYPEALKDPTVACMIAHIRGLEAALDGIMCKMDPEFSDD